MLRFPSLFSSRQRSREIANRDAKVYLASIAIPLLLLVFLIVSRLAAPEPLSFDQSILLALRDNGDLAEPWGPIWLEGIVADLTVLGSGVIVTMLSLIVIGYLLLLKHYRTAVLFAICITLAGISGYALKGIFERPRPMVIEPMFMVDSYSFPSGHSLISAAVYPTLGLLTARVVKGHLLRVYCLAVALGTTLLVGVTRVYLGVHYPTDVVAGWCVGLSWALTCWLLTRSLQRRGVVERTPVAEVGIEGNG